EPGDGGRGADNRMQGRHQGAGAIQLVLLVDALRRDDLAAADGLQGGDLIRRAVILDRDDGRLDLTQEMTPGLQGRKAQGTMATQLAAAPADADGIGAKDDLPA